MHKIGYQTRTYRLSFRHAPVSLPNKKTKEITKNNKLYVFLDYGLFIVDLNKYKFYLKDISFHIQCIQEHQSVHIISIPKFRNINDTLWNNGVVLFV